MSGAVGGRRRADAGGGWGLGARCIHQTRGGFHFFFFLGVKSRYQTGTGFASQGEGEAGRGGAERQEERKKCSRHRMAS